MARWVTINDVADAAYGVGFRGEALAIAIAVTKPESGMGAPEGYWADAEALGDTTITSATWGPSVGAWQVRSLNAERGKGTTRDRDALFGNLAKQALSAWQIAGGNTTTGSWGQGGNRGWGHWSVFQQGKHRTYLAEARAAGAAREASGGGGAIGGGGSLGADSGGGTGGSPTDRSPDVVIPAGTLPVAVVPPRRALDLVLFGTGSGPGSSPRLHEYLLDGEVDFSVDEASQLTLTLFNVAYHFLGMGRGLALRSQVAWRDIRWNVSAVELTGDAEPRAIYECRDRFVDLLKRTNVDAAGRAIGSTPRGVSVAGKKLSPTEYARIQAEGVARIRFMGEGSPRRTDIAPQKGDDGIYESPWEVIKRLADELGYMAFVAGDVLYFGRPTWLLARAQTVRVSLVPGAWGDHALNVVDRVNWRDTVDGFDGAELTVKLPRWRGEQVRPGMKLATKGLYGLSASEWLVHRVTWPVDDGRAPVTVEAREAVNPIVQARTAPTEPKPDGGQASSSSPSSTPGASASGFTWPARGPMTSGYRTSSRPNHEGIDLGIPVGTPIKASKAGTVARSARSDSYGEVIYVDHDDGTQTRYAHLSKRSVLNGAKVAQGQRIGDSGNTGRSTGPHLHFEVLRGGNPIDPMSVLP